MIVERKPVLLPYRGDRLDTIAAAWTAVLDGCKMPSWLESAARGKALSADDIGAAWEHLDGLELSTGWRLERIDGRAVLCRESRSSVETNDRDLDDVRAADLEGFTLPGWLPRDVTIGQLIEVAENGAQSGYIGEVVDYCDALRTMNEHGDAVLDYLVKVGTKTTVDFERKTWGGIACTLLSGAAEHFAGRFLDRVNDRGDPMILTVS